jgi:hypothetical protein
VIDDFARDCPQGPLRAGREAPFRKLDGLSEHDKGRQ